MLWRKGLCADDTAASRRFHKLILFFRKREVGYEGPEMEKEVINHLRTKTGTFPDYETFVVTLKQETTRPNLTFWCYGHKIFVAEYTMHCK
jgi:hypothetical protein